MQKQDYKELGYSIRKCNDDEIEVRLSVLDGYIRGVIRAILVGILLINMHFDTSHKIPLFSQEINSIKKDFNRAFFPDKIVTPLYNEYFKFSTDKETIELFGIKK